jgi:hypothetical protein
MREIDKIEELAQRSAQVLRVCSAVQLEAMRSLASQSTLEDASAQKCAGAVRVCAVCLIRASFAQDGTAHMRIAAGSVGAE